MKVVKKICIGLFIMLLFSNIVPTTQVHANEGSSLGGLSASAQADKIWVKRHLSFAEWKYPPKGYWVQQGQYQGYIYQIDVGPTYYVYAGYIFKAPYGPMRVINSEVE